jgi:hypothetical protein
MPRKSTQWAFSRLCAPSEAEVDATLLATSSLPRYLDFIVAVREADGERMWVCEPKGVADTTAYLKAQAARDWCEKVTSGRANGRWDYLFVRDSDFRGIHRVEQRSTFAEFASALLRRLSDEQVIWLSGPAQSDEMAAERE